VDFSNLQRQVTFATGDVGKHKTEAAKARLSGLNPTIEMLRQHRFRNGEG